ncbi:sensor histidine kinase [Terrimonas pollutisoli]|uniref:sensor histidine kinase n=1 Tax=Terrimonas pollutisoli TaxID=3034147 RepID=UPI0023EE2618|nr:HAMP domain-containing sensor histidine kinase [Terrimonas sp. H1YJ31]
MFQQLLNWRIGLAMIAILIVTGTVFYSRYVSHKIAKEERGRVIAFGESLKIKALSEDPNVLLFTNQIAGDNVDIPIIETDENDNPSGQYVNLDSTKVARDSNYLRKMVKHFGSINPPVLVEITREPLTYTKYYYGESQLQNEVRYYPLVQLVIVGLFIIVTLLTLRSNYRSVQNQVWAGMAKETAHQLGTPVSSLEGWVEVMKEKTETQGIAQELGKDVTRLRLVSDRFGKIGSKPQLDVVNIVKQVSDMVDYIRKRSPGTVSFVVNTHGKSSINATVSAPLFDWVIENLLKNGLDAMEGKGYIKVDIRDEKKAVIIDVTDTGKGIARQNISKVFKPGFTTKKRGWGLGLSLSKRIVEQYHKGEIFVRQSEPGKGTTFRIVLKK